MTDKNKTNAKAPNSPVPSSDEADQGELARDNVSATLSPYALDLDAESPLSTSPSPE